VVQPCGCRRLRNENLPPELSSVVGGLESRRVHEMNDHEDIT